MEPELAAVVRDKVEPGAWVLVRSQIAEERVPMATVRAGDPPVPKPPG